MTRPLAFNSEADAIKMALENLPSTKGSVTVFGALFSDQEKIEWQVTFDALQGGNVGR